MENSNLQQIIEWKETNSSIITNEINSEPFKCTNGNEKPAKTVSLTTETTMQNNGNERTIETKSKAVRKFDLDKENENENNSNDDFNRCASRCSSTNTVKTKFDNLEEKEEEEEETSFNSTSNQNKPIKCDRCEHEIKKRRSNKTKSKKDEQNEKFNKIIKKSSNYEEKLTKEENYSERFSNDNYQKEMNPICVNNVNLDFSYLMPENKLFDFTNENLSIENYKKLPNYLFQPFDQSKFDQNIDFIDGVINENSEENLNKKTENLKSNQLNDNLSKLSFDSGHSSSMSSISYQTKPNKLKNSIEQCSINQVNNLDNLSDLNSLNLLNTNNYLVKSESNLQSNDNRELGMSLARSEEFSKSLVPKIRGNNFSRNTEIINRITKTTYPETIKKKKIKKKKFVFEQQLNSPSTSEEQNDCKISSLITMEIPCNLRKKSKCSKCYKDKKLDELYRKTSSFQNNSELENSNSTSLSSTCSETDSLTNEDDLNTLTKFQKFKPVLINKDDDQTTWEYSLECKQLNGVNASVK